MQIAVLLVLILAFICYGVDSTSEFMEDLNLAKNLYQKSDYNNAILLIEQHSELIGFYHPDAQKVYSDIIDARNLLGNCYIKIGDLQKALEVFQETNGATDYSDSYALYQTALFTILFDDKDSITEILSDMRLYNLTPDYRLYTLLLSVMEKNEGKLILEKIETSLKDKIGVSSSGRALVDFLLNRINEEELLAKTDSANFCAIKYFVGLKNEKYSGSIEKAKQYYIEVYNKSEDLYKWLAAKRLGFYGIQIKDYENYYDYSDEWVIFKSSSTLLGKTKPYHVNEIIDKDPKTAWVEGKPDDGIGEWVEFTFKPRIMLESISIINGYTRSETLYQANNRVKKMRISFDDGTYFDRELKDGEHKPQIITLPEAKQTGKFRLIILEIYKGSKYNDTCISEVLFDYIPLPEP